MTKRSSRIAGENELILIAITRRQITHFSMLNDIAISQSYAGNHNILMPSDSKITLLRALNCNGFASIPSRRKIASIDSKFGLRKMILNNTCKMPDRMASLLITADAPALK